MHPEQLVRRIAGRQLNLIDAQQALEAGFSRDQLRHRARTGVFTRIYRGVYLVTGGAPSVEQRALAACMATGDGARVSDLAAAAVWGFAEFVGGSIDVTVPAHRHPAGARGLRVHRRTLVAADRTIFGSVPITTPPRTLLDVAGGLDHDALERLCDEAFRSRVSPIRLLDYLSRSDLARCRGIATLRSIATDRAGLGVPESALERDAIASLRAYRLPEPVRQYAVRASGRLVRFDLAYPDARVAIELDGRGPHWGRVAWQTDHDRNNATTLDGWRVLRFTWWDVHERPVHVALTVADALGIRPRRWARRKRSDVVAR